MKDDKHTIDDLFKDRLYDVESDVQLSSWNDISKKIQTLSAFSVKKWFYGLGVVSTLVLVSYISMYTNGTDGTQVAQVTQEIHTKQEPQHRTVVSDSMLHMQKEASTNSKKTQTEMVPAESTLQEVAALDERKTIKLPDGSEVILNRNSSISYSTRFASDRTIYVLGEVYVHVTEADKKFIVISDRSKIETAESSFIIKSDKSLSYDQIFVSTGEVDCKSLLANEDRMVIFAGNNAVIDKDGGFKQNAIDDVNYNDWVTQKIRFNNTDLKTVFVTLEKYYNVSLKADNPEIMNCHFTGTFERNNINEILQVLSVSFNLSFNQKSKEYILSGKGCK